MSTTTAPTAAAATQAVEPTVLTVTVSNICQCMFCDDCGVMFEEAQSGPDVCPECESTEHVTFGNCEGFCYESGIEALSEVVREWAANNPSVDNEWVITGKGMGWRNLTGTKHVDLTRACLSGAVSVNAEWTQTWTIETEPGGRLTCTQSHHDSPTGESYSVAPLR